MFPHVPPHALATMLGALKLRELIDSDAIELLLTRQSDLRIRSAPNYCRRHRALFWGGKRLMRVGPKGKEAFMCVSYQVSISPAFRFGLS
jgi:hypothetical protein